ANSVNLRVTKDDGYRVAAIEQEGGNSQLIRVVSMNGIELRLYCTSAQIHPTRLESGALIITVRIPEKPENESNPLNLRFDLKEASSGTQNFVPSGGAQDPSKELLDAIISGINKGIEDFLVIANARKG